MLFNEHKNVRTIIFSELPKSEKMKYFNFLLENEINFTKDENGDYLALIKILNPQFYKNEKAREKIMKEEELENEKEEPKVEDNRYFAKNKSTSPPKNKAYKKTNPVLTKDKNEKKVVSKRDSVEKKIPDPKNLFVDRYHKYMKSLAPLIGVRGKKLNLNTLKYMIEEIYSIRFVKDTSKLKSQLNKKNDEEIKDPFPTFCVDFLVNKFVKKNLIDQHGLDLVLSVDFFRSKFKDVEIFHKFLNEEYDSNDLIFFLFVRSCVEKEMKIMFIEKAREEMKIQYNDNKEEIDNEIYLNVKNCLKIANTIFGSEQEYLLNSFMDKIEKNLTNNQKKGKNLIKASTILEITLEDYHESNKLQNNDNQFLKNEHQSEQQEFELDKQLNSRNIPSNTSIDKPKSNPIVMKPEDKINYLKKIITDYLKDKELDTFFEKILDEYSYSEKENEFIQKTILNIKDLVSKKISVLVNILFIQSKEKWYSSLQIKNPKTENENHFNKLMKAINKLMESEIENITEELIESVGVGLIGTPELIVQIQNLVLKYLK